jgi:CHAT domain-containing protein
MTVQKASSRRLFQIGLADTLYASGTISERVADLLFTEVLREPTASDWTVEPMETLAVAVTPHPGPFLHWFDVAAMRNDQEKAIEISDRIRRHRFFSTLPMGGRLIALRWILEAPEGALSQQARLQRQDLLGRYPNYAKLSTQAATIRKGLEALPLAPDDAGQTKQQTQLLEQLAEISTAQEIVLRQLALRREPSELVFPPLRSVKEIQQAMPEGQLILAYLATDRYVAGFALAKQNHAVWQLEAPAKVAGQIADLLKQIGLNDRKVSVDLATLKDSSWKETASELLAQLANNATAENWAEYNEVVIVPDGPLWYVPFEALQIAVGAKHRPLISETRIRYVPTLSLANGDGRGHKPNARTAVVTGKMLPGQDAQVTADAFEDIRLVLPGASRLATRLPAPSGYVAAVCDRAIVLNDLERNARTTYGWSPMYLDRPKPGDSLDSWLALPWHGPSQLVLPGWHTPAESALKRGGTGNDVFLAICGLMASGSRSVLLSRWPVGGQSTFDLIREYVQELPFAPATAAWQRSVRLARGALIDPELEPRINASGLREDLKADHPFFWAGYLLADTGTAPKQDGP